MGIKVECYSGYRGDETPRRFSLDGRLVEVTEVLDSWLTPDHRHFKLRGSDGAQYILRQVTKSGEWELTLLGPAPAGCDLR